MEISLFIDDSYYEEIGKELVIRGHNVVFNKISDNTDSVLIFGCPAAFLYTKYLNDRYSIERFRYNGKTYPIVFDIPYWRLTDLIYNEYYTKYKNILIQSTKILSISESTANQLKNIWNLDSQVIKYMFNDRLINQYKITKPRNPDQIIMVSRFATTKRFDLVIRAVQGTKYKLVMCGRPTGMEKYYHNLAESLNIDFEMHINPDYKFIVEKYCDSGLCIHASMFEGFSLVPKEALYCNCPVLLSDIPTHLEYHKTGVTYFKTDEFNDLKMKLTSDKFKKPNTKEIKDLTISRYVDRLIEFLNDNI